MHASVLNSWIQARQPNSNCRSEPWDQQTHCEPWDQQTHCEQLQDNEAEHHQMKDFEIGGAVLRCCLKLILPWAKVCWVSYQLQCSRDNEAELEKETDCALP